MGRFLRVLSIAISLFCAAAAAAIAQAAAEMERVEVAGQPPYEGLIESESDASIYLIQIRRRPGKPMHLVIRPIDRRLVTNVVRLDAAGQERLRREIDQFRNRAAIEAGRMEAISLAPLEAEGLRYQHYHGKWFSLDSTADESTTRRIIVRSEQIFAAYRQIMPPRTMPAAGPRLVVLGSMAEYQAFLARLPLAIQSRACFVEDKNLVVAGSELGRLVALMAKINAQNEHTRNELRNLENRLRDRLRDLSERLKKDGVPNKEVGRLLTIERAKFDEQKKKLREDLARCDREAARAFHQHTRQMFARLYHEAFHAYLENYVYAHRDYDVPRWLNEGLAVMFEGGMLEGDTLRLDAPNAVALKKLKEDLRGGPLPLAKLLAAGPEAFLPLGDKPQAATDRNYVYAWGLAYYLAHEKRLLGSAEMDRYVARSQPAPEPIERFQRLVGVPLDQFEKNWTAYILSLGKGPI
jgi:hypothetical protein